VRSSRLWDVAAALAIGFALWKIFLAPRSFAAPHAQPAPHAVFQRLDGGAFRLADERNRIVFLDFYASWCTPCKIEMPLVQHWANAHRDALVVPVDVGEDRAAVADFAGRYRLNDVAIDPSSSARALFAVQGFPTIVVVDGAGDIRARWEGLNPAIGLAMSNALSLGKR
jgi:thiol-disulfide isomerase/thioredoxin